MDPDGWMHAFVLCFFVVASMLLQRLAQLSEVHRRLLWKFGEVELERAAFEKKVRNRYVKGGTHTLEWSGVIIKVPRRL